MNEKTEESVKNHISTDDLSSFEWRILKYMCSVTGIYDTFPEILLFHRTDLKHPSILNSVKNIFRMKGELSTNSL